ncbi:unnamed protein product, partial [Haemonchus placei]|uniref:Smr domain-containing protein n=1 Tax=Haemonchus placei TaxID=6290 RepID=A0A0N4VVB3_HAEPC
QQHHLISRPFLRYFSNSKRVVRITVPEAATNVVSTVASILVDFGFTEQRKPGRVIVFGTGKYRLHSFITLLMYTRSISTKSSIIDITESDIWDITESPNYERNSSTRSTRVLTVSSMFQHILAFKDIGRKTFLQYISSFYRADVGNLKKTAIPLPSHSPATLLKSTWDRKLSRYWGLYFKTRDSNEQLPRRKSNHLEERFSFSLMNLGIISLLSYETLV